MAITIRGGAPARSPTTGSDGSATVQVTLTGTQSPQVNDVLFISHKNDFYTLANMPTPTVGGSSSGVTSIINADGGTNSGHIKGWYFRVTSAGDVTVAATETGTHDEDKQMVVYPLVGVETSGSPIDGSSQAASSSGVADQVLPQITGMTRSDNLLIIEICSGGGAAAHHYGEPAGMTQAYDEVIDGFMNSGGATQQLASSADTGTRTYQAQDSGSSPQAVPWAGIMVAFKTAAAGGSGAWKRRPSGLLVRGRSQRRGQR